MADILEDTVNNFADMARLAGVEPAAAARAILRSAHYILGHASDDGTPPAHAARIRTMLEILADMKDNPGDLV